MFIRELFKQKRFTLSFEFFPPKREGNLEGLFVTIQELSSLKPDFISVTYGAGGSTREKSLEIASRVKKEFQTEVLAHLTCVQSSKNDIARILEAFRAEHIENILALRGDPPAGTEKFIKPEVLFAGVIFHTLLNATNGDVVPRGRTFLHQKNPLGTDGWPRFQIIC